MTSWIRLYFLSLCGFVSTFRNDPLVIHELDLCFSLSNTAPISKDIEMGTQMSKLIVLELALGGHQIIQGLRKCAYSRLESCF